MARVLIIDDSWLIRKTVAGFLKAHGYEYKEATGGEEGIAFALEYKPDCIFLDLLMPDIDGFDVLEKFKEKNVTAPVIILTADIQETTKQKCFKAGAFEFLQKPPKEEMLIYKLKKAIQQ